VSMKHFHASTATQFYFTMKRNIQNEFRYGGEGGREGGREGEEGDILFVFSLISLI